MSEYCAAVVDNEVLFFSNASVGSSSPAHVAFPCRLYTMGYSWELFAFSHVFQIGTTIIAFLFYLILLNSGTYGAFSLKKTRMKLWRVNRPFLTGYLWPICQVPKLPVADLVLLSMLRVFNYNVEQPYEYVNGTC